MPKKKGTSLTDLIIVALIALLLLKGLGLLKAWFDIDPNGVTFTIDVGFVASAGLFALLWHRLNTLNDRLSELGERIAKVEPKGT